MIEANQLRELLANEASPRVVIIGDLIVDRYISGDVSRISPEAPIPVLAARSSELRLGGAGNVAANLRAMEAEVAMVGVVGDDSHGALLRELFEADGIGTGGVILDSSRPTIEKTRMMSGVQQMLHSEGRTQGAGAARLRASRELLQRDRHRQRRPQERE